MFKKSYLREGGIRTCFPCILEKKNTDKATLTNTKLWTDTEVKDANKRHNQAQSRKREAQSALRFSILGILCQCVT